MLCYYNLTRHNQEKEEMLFGMEHLLTFRLVSSKEKG